MKKSKEVPNKTFLVKRCIKGIATISLASSKAVNIPFWQTGVTGKNHDQRTYSCCVKHFLQSLYHRREFKQPYRVAAYYFEIKSDAEIAVIEMGANHLKRWELHCKTAAPSTESINQLRQSIWRIWRQEGVKKPKENCSDYRCQRRDGTASDVGLWLIQRNEQRYL